MVNKRLIFFALAFAPSALMLCTFDTQPLPLWRSHFVHAGCPQDIPQIPYDIPKISPQWWFGLVWYSLEHSNLNVGQDGMG